MVAKTCYGQVEFSYNLKSECAEYFFLHNRDEFNYKHTKFIVYVK
jgi:hypothetical protein